MDGLVAGMDEEKWMGEIIFGMMYFKFCIVRRSRRCRCAAIHLL